MKKVICFDLWHTLISSPVSARGYWTEIRPLENTDAVYDFVRESLMTVSSLSYKEMVERLFGHLYALDERSKHECRERVMLLWEEENSRAQWFPGAVPMLQTLRESGHALVLVTNTTWMGWKAVEDMVAPHFDKVFISCLEGVAKPDPRVWERIQGWFPEAKPSDFVMVGDSEEHDLAVPRRMGWTTLEPSSIVNPDFLRVLSAADGGIKWERIYKERVLILDTLIPVEESRKITQAALALGFTPISALDFVRRFEEMERELFPILCPREAIVLLPENGARAISVHLSLRWEESWLACFRIVAKRLWEPGTFPQAIGGRIFLKDRMLLGVKDVVILDDVISSGATCSLLKRVNEAWIPGAKWHAVALVKQRSAQLKGFSSVSSVMECGTKSRKASINSLSTLLNNPEFAETYARRNFSDPCPILKFLEKVREMQIP